MAHPFTRANRIAEPHFRWRAEEMTRMEAFSDAVFAFAVTLLVVALEVPHNFEELKHVMAGFPGFAASFALLIIIWHNHVKFLRRYGLQNAWAVFLNTALLFIVLFYVYPLKFLFSLILSRHEEAMITVSQIPTLMTIYGLGYASVFLVLTLMYVHAYRLRKMLDLNEAEIYVTRRALIDNVAMVGFGLACALLSRILPPNRSGLSGFVFAFIGIYFTIAGRMMGRHEKRIYERVQKSAAASH
jgi:uncharacterized membrane protein